MTTNIDRAREAVAAVCSAGVEDFCVCSGSRDAPLIAVLGATPGIRLRSFIDERSAAFFAVGAARRSGKPVAIVTTSGTAVAELLPATVEAYYSSVPIVLLTADRPARFRGTGAPQSIEQEAIFGPYAVRAIEGWDRSTPLHWNLEFDEPLIDAAIDAATTGNPPGSRVSRSAARVPDLPFADPVVIVGRLDSDDRPLVREFLTSLRAPVYAEALSGLREDEALREILVTNERMLARGGFDGVIRIGGVPTLRFWRDLDDRWSGMPVVHFSRRPFAGLSRGEVHSIDALPQLPSTRDRRIDFFAVDREMSHHLSVFLDAEPLSELAMIRALSLEIPSTSRVYLGNSLPIREWDLVATREARSFAIEGNRGANGIDGQLSTFFGWCADGAHNVAILGDLTTIYDMNAPWILPQIDCGFRVIIINNSGGRIFERVAGLQRLEAGTRSRLIENAHSFRFSAWSEMWGLDYAWISRLPSGISYRTRTREVVELVPDLEATRRVWRRYDALWE